MGHIRKVGDDQRYHNGQFALWPIFVVAHDGFFSLSPREMFDQKQWSVQGGVANQNAEKGYDAFQD